MNAFHQFPPQREAALERLARFVPDAGTKYAQQRNTDFGSVEANSVSALSPYLRRRVMTEQEIREAVLTVHSGREAEKFLKEVSWRTYFKGWLERRPQIWEEYKTALEGLQTEGQDADWFDEAQSVFDGTHSLDCMQVWSAELKETGYLHNHARMWFAGIWIYTLGLPWEMGADFFARHLLDGDPASNTLSWRWVAGLHTKGKRYKAGTANIRKYTKDRLGHQELDHPYSGPAFKELPEVGPVPIGAETLPESFTLLLCAEDWAMDLPEALSSGAEKVILLEMDDWPRVWAPSERVLAYERLIMEEAERRWASVVTVERMSVRHLPEYLPEGGMASCVMPVIPVGPRRDAFSDVWAETGEPVWWLRDWDADAWPAATAGFFRFWKALMSERSA